MPTHDLLCKSTYNDPSTTTRTPALLAERAGVPLAAAKAFLAQEKTSIVNKRWVTPPEGSPQYCPTGAPAFHWQSDVIYFKLLKSKNKQKQAILTVINTTSRFAYARAVESNSSKFVSVEMADILEEMKRSKQKITHMRVDGGSEFKGETRTLFDSKNITVDQAEPYTHFRIRRTDAFHRTLRNRLGAHFERENTNTWINVLHATVTNLNNTPHAALSKILERSVSPKDITPKDEDKIRAYEMKLAVASHLEIDKLNVVIGRTRVRLLVAKTKEGGKDKYAKSHRANWSVDTYMVIARNGPNSFLIDVPPKEIKIWPAHSLLILSEEDSEKETNRLEPTPIMGTGGKFLT